MPNDPKWRTIARASKQPISAVIAVYIHLMTCASTQPNATERGRTHGWRDEDVANALDMETEEISAIITAMQGRVLDGDYLKGWDRRQSVREDEGSADRSKVFREREKARKLAEELAELKAANADRTQPNATERKKTLEVEVEVEVEKESKAKPTARATRLPNDWMPSPEDDLFCQTERQDLISAEVAQRFRDYWISQPGSKGVKQNWSATWRNWVRNERPGKMPAKPAVKDWI